MNRTVLYTIIIVITSVVNFKAQDARVSLAQEFAFVQYLLANNLYDDANSVLKKCKTDLKEELSASTIDSINFLIASNYHKIKKFDSCIVYLKNNNLPELSTRSISMLSYAYSYTGKRQLGDSLLSTLKTDTASDLGYFILYQKTASALLTRNYAKFDTLSKLLTNKDYRLAKEEKDILVYASDYKKIKKKSPFVAGLLSAIIPGSGKLYAGYRGKAWSSFMPTAIFATVTAESIYRDGFNTPQTYVFGSLFTTFYLGSIVGSAYSVKQKRADKYKELDNELFFDTYNSYNRYK